MANLRELQGALVKELDALGLPGAEKCVLQVQTSGADLVARIRYPQLAMKTKTNALQPFTEHRYEAGALAAPHKVKKWIRNMAHDSLVLLRTDMMRLRMPWPTGWPVIEAQRILVMSGTTSS